MKMLPALLIALATASIAEAQLRTATSTDSGGRDVTVALFSSHAVREVTVTPVGAAAWTADCATCTRRALTAPTRFNGPKELFAGGSLRVVDAASGEVRSSAGLWHLKAIAGSLDIVLTLTSERYVANVLAAETDVHEPTESLRTMAIIARTYALNGTHYTALPGHLKADLCDSTECQAAHFAPVSSAIEQAVRDTAGETLRVGSKRAEVYFSQSCGGMTEAADVVWPRSHADYLRAHADPYCVRGNGASWHTEVALKDLAALAADQHWKLPGDIVSIEVTKRSVAHRALLVKFTSRNGADAVVSAAALRLAIGRALGWNHVRSDWYDVGVRNGSLVFDGRGFGHGVGLCQFGAAEMAAEHKTAAEILAFYFPGTHVGVMSDDAGWTIESIAGVAVLSIASLTNDQKRMIEAAWARAQRLFPSRTTGAPELTFAPSVELFRQMTSQPGWMLASTSGLRIVVQPQSIVGVRLAKTIEHEMLHVLVEAEASTKSPLWLREGLVEALDGESGDAKTSDAAMEAELARPSTHDASLRAHSTAAAKVRAMISRYGLTQVRSWLATGLPAGVN